MSLKGLIIAAPHSNSGKTFITLSILRALKQAGHTLASAKVGPDYIDPAFHSLAGSNRCLNLDGWAMRPESLCQILSQLETQSDLVICEGAMGLFDGAISLDEEDGSGADLARRTGWSVVLVVDAARQARSVCALIKGFMDFDPRLTLKGVIFNQVGGDSHRRILETACARDLPNLKILGCVARRADLVLPQRHLGLVQAEELETIDHFLNESAAHIANSLDLEAIVDLAAPHHFHAPQNETAFMDPWADHIAIAKDHAFSFLYPALLSHWRAQGTHISFFSPLADESPDLRAGAIYLPGGYPELHGAQLAHANHFKSGLLEAAQKGTFIFGECGGYMTLGQGLIDQEGTRHEMVGLLDLETSFAERKLHLGYREATVLRECRLAPKGTVFRGHEFHYSRVTHEKGDPLFDFQKSDGQPLGHAGLIKGSVMGSFLHMIDRA